MPKDSTSISALGVILAGGHAQRMGGGDKSLRCVGGRTIFDRTIARLTPQCESLLLSANGDPTRFAEPAILVVADTIKGFPGPLAGILAALEWTAVNKPDIAWVVSVPSDCPFLPVNLVSRLQQARIEQNAQLAVAASAGRSHPVIALWNVDLRDELRHALVAEDIRKVGRWSARYRLATATWPADPVDPFFNINTREDLAEAERLAAFVDVTG